MKEFYTLFDKNDYTDQEVKTIVNKQIRETRNKLEHTENILKYHAIQSIYDIIEAYDNLRLEAKNIIAISKAYNLTSMIYESKHLLDEIDNSKLLIKTNMGKTL